MFEIFVEFILQFVLEIFGDVIIHVVSSNERVRNVIVAVLFYAAAGAGVGYLTTLIFPEHFIREENLRVLNLIVTPLAIAAAMTWIGHIRQSRDRRVIRLEQFGYAPMSSRSR